MVALPFYKESELWQPFYVCASTELARIADNAGAIANNTQESTAVILFLGSTQKSVSAAPSQKNSPTAPEASVASAGGRMRTAKSMPNPNHHGRPW
jgi:hypothetical protein